MIAVDRSTTQLGFLSAPQVLNSCWAFPAAIERVWQDVQFTNCMLPMLNRQFKQVELALICSPHSFRVQECTGDVVDLLE